ncbi:MAG: hypothetical protein RL654_3566, partial [Pseudomonadota bacterium]
MQAHSASVRADAVESATLPLLPNENVLTTLEVDLDERLHFARARLQLTERRLVDARGDWPLRPDLSLRHHDHAGVGTLELHDGGGRLALWRFTLAQNVQALRLVRLFEQRIEQLAQAGHAHPDEDSADPTRCPTCRAPLPPDSDDCAICTRELTTPPSTWVLLRLWRFARPYRWTLLAGFLLTLASTAATLVPPYLTIPLMDEVLIPFQNGQSIDTHQVGLLLGGLFGSGLLAWGLGWARTWLLALVSERIAADLRTTAFDHLLGLSLDYFGAKRTGDLIARIGSETDRLSVFLSLHALDFATDVLMLGMTAVIL